MRRFLRRYIPALLAGLLLLTGACTGTAGKGLESNPARDGMKAVWVSTVYNLDYPVKGTTDPAQLKAQADEILQNCVSLGMNAVFLQVRPSADALYPSAYFPWSKYLTGTPGAAPDGGFDPLAYWVGRAHALGLELHAWLNPYRITKGGQAEYDALPSDSPAKLHPDWVVEHEGNFYFDPALPQVRELVIQGAEEICRNYEIDGVHLDDYFYPGAAFNDDASFAAYGAGFSDKGDWRRENVNKLVRELGERVHAVRPELSYGISPSGVWADRRSLAAGSDTTGGYESYFSSYADSRKWVQEGWIDYICPQIYWQIGHPTMDYQTIARWWADTVAGTGVRLYLGMADYKACDADPASPWYGTAAIAAQLDLNDALDHVSGEVHFRYKFLVVNPALTELYKARAGQSGAAVPPTPTPSPTPAPTPSSSPVPSPAPGGGGMRLAAAPGEGYIQGSEGKFRPDAPLTRAEAVALLSRLSTDQTGAPLYTGAAYAGGFSDVTGADWFAPQVAFARASGVVSGYLDGSFRPHQAVSRSELVKLLCAYFDGVDRPLSLPFSDLPADHWALPQIAFAAEQGWVAGYLDGSFQPDRAVSRAEAVKILNAALGRVPDQNAAAHTASPFTDVAPGHWAYAEILSAAGAL